MRSPADASRARVGVEWALRLAALVSLLVLLWRATRPPVAAQRVRTVTADAFATWRDSTAAGDTLRLALAAAPAPATRDGIAALAAAGRVVRWRDAGVPALAAMAEPARAPDATPTLVVAAPAGSALAMGDEAGVLDSVRVAGGVASLAMPGGGGGLRARVGATEARVAVRDSLALRRVLVVGRAGWEAKFAIAALEEAGWLVDADVAVAPGARVVQGGSAGVSMLPDTARHAAVVLIDSSAAALASRAAAVVRFVRAGGGAVVAGDAALARAFAGLRAGAAGPRVAGEAGALAASAPRRGLPLRAVTAGPDAVVLERRGGTVAAAARRVGAGRVVQLGYEDTWRWRMEGDDGAPAAHRRWWSAVVASVARAPVAARLDSAYVAGAVDPAPRAALVAAMDAPVADAAPTSAPARPVRLPDSLLLAAALLALLGEWASRRLRGAR